MKMTPGPRAFSMLGKGGSGAFLYGAKTPQGD